MRVKPKNIIFEYQRRGKATLAAEDLEIHRSTVYRWVRKFQFQAGVGIL
jgi:transcriptional regulator of acetoin/glycerol metabolism